MKRFYTTLILLALVFNSFAQDEKKEQKADSVKKETKKKDLPLEVGRTIPIKTNEGTWMSVDISPDGKTLAFDFLGDIYLMPVTGGKAEPFTHGLAFDSQPRFSPDGKHLLFISDKSGAENAWYFSLDKKDSVQVTKDKAESYQSAEWTPDGNYIIVAKGRLIHKLHMYHKDGGGGAQLITKPENLKTVEPAFGPDNRYIWFSQRNGPWNYNAQLPQYELAVYDRETGERELKTTRYGSAFTPTLSPDGKWLVYGSRYNDETGLIKRNLATGEEQWLAYPVQRDEQESIAPFGVLPAMTFTPDSKDLIVSYGGKFWRLPIAGGNAVEIPFTVDTNLDMGPKVEFKYPIKDDAEFVATQIRDSKVSPDGKRLAFTVLNRLYTMDLPNGTPKRVTAANYTEATPAWSADGTQLAWVTWENNGGHIYKINFKSKGAKPTKLTTKAALYYDPVWAFASNRIVFGMRPSQNYYDQDGPVGSSSEDELAWISGDGGAITTIDKARGRSNPHFVKSKTDRIYFYHEGKGLISIKWDGTDEKEHLKATGITTFGFALMGTENCMLAETAEEPTVTPSNASVIIMAPEGDQALVQINNELYSVTVPITGGDVPKISLADANNAQFPSRKLTKLGGEFPSWNSNGKIIYWTLGNAFFTYNLDSAKAKDLEIKKNKAEEAKKKEEDKDSKEKTSDKKDEKKDEGYKPSESRVTVKIPLDIPKGKILLQGARVITMKGNEIIESGDILIENNRIKQVGPSGSIAADASVQKMDVKGKTIIPGFVDTHAHLRPAWGIHKNDVWPYAANLAYGLTTTRDPQTGTTDVLTYEDMVKAGQIAGPRIYSTGPGVGFWAYNIKDLDQARDILKQYSEYYNTKTIKMYLTGNRQQRQWIIMAAKEQSLMPTTEGALNFKLNLTQIMDGYPGHEHSFPIYPLYKDFTTLMANSGTTYTPTLLVSYGGPWAENYYYATENVNGDPKLNMFTPKSDLDEKSRRRPGWFMYEEHVFPDHAKFVKDLVEAGGNAGVGSHGQLQGLGYHWELWSIQSGGLSTHDALKVATIHGAKAIGLDGDVGSIEPGKLADLIILDKNPLENIRNSNSVNKVMKNGRLYDGNSLDEVYPSQKKASFNWEQSKPTTSLPGIKK